MERTNEDGKAPPARRVAAYAIDSALIVAVAQLLAWTVTRAGAERAQPGAFWAVASFATVLFLLRDAPSGASPGKWLMGLAVRDAAHPRNPPDVWRLLLRNVPLLLGPLEVSAWLRSGLSWRLGDRWARSVVVDVRSR